MKNIIIFDDKWFDDFVQKKGEDLEMLTNVGLSFKRINDDLLLKDKQELEKLKGIIEKGNDEIIFLIHPKVNKDPNWKENLKHRISKIKSLTATTLNIESINIYPISEKHSDVDDAEILDVLCIDKHLIFYPHTYKNLTALKTKKSDDTIEKNTFHQPIKIFISHSSLDDLIIQKFIKNYLVDCIGLKESENIFYSSDSLTGVTPGSYIDTTIKNELEKSSIFLCVLSENYKKSETCLMELGIAFYKFNDSKFIILRLPNTRTDEIPWIFDKKLCPKIDDLNALYKIFRTEKGLLKLLSESGINQEDETFRKYEKIYSDFFTHSTKPPLP